MPIVSYAQNFEDVILWRALKHIACGFYVDIGAQDPVIDSVSLAFYEQGWRGIHVEPIASFAEKLRQARPDEEVIAAAVSDQPSDLVFYSIPDTGLSTGKLSIAKRHSRQGYKYQEVRVPCIRLSEILEQHRGRDVHWLKIDVEGMEREVLRSWLPSQVRPWVVLLESTEPNSPQPNFDEWENLLVGLGYNFVYFDGLNRFYVHDDHEELRASFGAGPNVFDDFVLSGRASQPFCARLNSEQSNLRDELVKAREEGAKLTSAVGSLHQQIETLDSEINYLIKRVVRLDVELNYSRSREGILQQQQLTADEEASLRETGLRREIASLNERLAGIYQSTSWRATAPLRLVGLTARRLIRGARSFVSGQARVRRVVGSWPSSKSINIQLDSLKPQSGSMPGNGATDASSLPRACEMAGGLSSMVARPQLLVDVSAIARVDYKTGIQRVVKAQLLALLDNPPSGYTVEPIRLCDINGEWGYCYARRYKATLLSLPTESFGPDDPVHIAKGDIFFAPDFDVDGVIQAATKGIYADWRGAGVQINFLVHDLLPLMLPNFFPGHVEHMHAKWLGVIADNADRLICVSAAVAKETTQWLAAHKPEVLANLQIVVSHHGADIEASDASRRVPVEAGAVLKQLSSRLSFLMVGTIEPRKGHAQVLAAFDELWSLGEELNLVLVGNSGWNVDDLLAKLRAHPELGRRLFWLEGISDEYLKKVYDCCSCLIAASENEGFGLPLIEAARHGLPILARDIEVFREVAGVHASYFSGRDPEDFAQALKAWLALFANNEHPQSHHLPWLTWVQSTERLKQILLEKAPSGVDRRTHRSVDDLSHPLT